MRVTRDRASRAVYLDQTSYIESFLHQFGMEQSKARSTPMQGYEALRKTTQDDDQGDRQLYQTMIGKIIFAIIYTRPDICFIVSRLS